MTLFVEAQGPADAIHGALRSIAGVVNVSLAEQRDAASSFQVDSEKGADIRREVAAAIVRGGWGLLELRPMRMSLEDIFLELTTTEADEPVTPAEPAEPVASQEAPNA